MNQEELLKELNALVKRRDDCKSFIDQCVNILANDPHKTAQVIGEDVFFRIMSFERDTLHSVLADLDAQILRYRVTKDEPMPKQPLSPIQVAIKKTTEEKPSAFSPSEKEAVFLNEKPVDFTTTTAKVTFLEEGDDFCIQVDKPIKKQSKAKLK